MTLRLAAGELRLTVPARTGERAVGAFLADNAAWAADRLAAAEAPPRLEHRDRLALFDDALVLHVLPGARRAAWVHDGRLCVGAAVGEDVEGAVERWYRRQARVVLGDMAHRRAAAMGLHVAAVSIRDPRSRWGSCSAGGRLSFSWRLLLTPEWVAEHVVTHEVCHLRHLDHSPAFWRLVRAQDPATDRAREWLRVHGPSLRLGPAWRRRAPGGRSLLDVEAGDQA